MPTKTDGKNVVKTEPKQGLINRYGSGWGVPPGLETGTRLTAKEQKKAEKTYVNVQSDTERLVKRGRWSPK